MVLNIDLNHPVSTVDDMDDLVDVSLSIRPPGSSQASRRQTARIELVDDEVIICSPTRFAEAREKAIRNRRVVEGINDDLGRSSSNGKNQGTQGRVKPTIADSDCCIILEVNEIIKTNSVAKGRQMSQNIRPKEPKFSCPVCMGSLIEETSTKCGHIFCKECINKAISAQSKCPTCRRKLKAKDTFRIYLPTGC